MPFNYIDIIRDSIETSINLKIFKTKMEAINAHIYNSELVKFLLSNFRNIENFNPNRLQNSAVKAYPISDRPRGNNDITSVKFHQKQIQNNKSIQPIWLVYNKKDNKYTLLDGVHRIVASYIENKDYINAYIIHI